MTERLVVLLSGQVVGHLERAASDDDPSFSYTAEYVQDGEVALSARLPIQRGTHPAKRVKPYLFGLLPENENARAAWSDQLGVSAEDAFGILAAMGWDCPGAVQFCREEDLEDLRTRDGEHHPISDTDIAERIRALADEEPSWTMPGEHWSLGGQQEKFALAKIDGRWHTAHGSAATTHIVKPGIRQLHHQALVEHVTMEAASAVGVVVAKSTFTRFGEQWAIVIDRFDRSLSGDRVLRTHQEDFAQACGRMPAHKYEAGNGPRLADMMRIMTRESTGLFDDRLALADFLLINLVAGAPDGHAKNISILRAPGLTRVAPLYDLATGLAYDARNVERSVALSIGGERIASRIRRHQLRKAAETLGLDPELLIGRVVGLAEAFPKAFEESLEGIADSAPGAQEVAERALPALQIHTRHILDRLGDH
ncbi:serine/threonine-protein kinase HipA [Nocardiopsis sp. Huas11]|uniref:HipA domain-containing protein n=1 Tax=Nocardiopsis sp. Huas11 TaxID=2183912 RepID=UPI000EB56F20|nr:HipA domain-containing protein [Nocardiopsis sp. Huas11]RKS06812.1 serine/threonine-protein kinase HipA [Nocardiopsis sp. Huas11]